MRLVKLYRDAVRQNSKNNPSKPDTLVLFTATHCNFPPESVEFANAKTTLQVWGNSGYFSVPVSIEGQNQLGEFARTGAPYLEQYGGVKALSKWSRETSEGASLGVSSQNTREHQRHGFRAGQACLCL